MDDMKWTAVFVGMISLLTAGCCNQPCSWCNWCGGGQTYAPPPPAYAPYPGPVTTGPMTSAPMVPPAGSGMPSASAMPTTTLR